MALRPVQRIKHVVDAFGSSAAANVQLVTLVAQDDAPSLADTDAVQTGSSVNGIYLKIEVASNENEVMGATPNVYLAVYKSQADLLPAINPSTVGANNNKRFVIHQEMILIQNTNGGNPRILFNGVIAIPRGYKRFATNDKLYASIFCGSINIQFCVQCHYKEFR